MAKQGAEDKMVRIVREIDSILSYLTPTDWEEYLLSINESNKNEVRIKKEDIHQQHWERMDEVWTPERLNFEEEETRTAKENLRMIRSLLQNCLVHDCLHKLLSEFPEKNVQSNRAEWSRIREKIDTEIVANTANIDVKTKEDLFKVLDMYEECYREIMVTLEAWEKELDRRCKDLPVKTFETFMKESIKGYLDYQQDTLNSFESNIQYNHTVSKKNLVMCIDDVQLRQAQDLLEMEGIKLEVPFDIVEMLRGDLMNVLENIPGYVRKPVDDLNVEAQDLQCEIQAKNAAMTSVVDLQLIVEQKKAMLQRDAAKMIADIMKQNAEQSAEDFDHIAASIEEANEDYLVLLDKHRQLVQESFATRTAEMKIARGY